MGIVSRLAWRNLWRHPRRTWLTTGAMIFSNVLLVFMISVQFGMYGMMIDNTLNALSGHMQVQATGYKDDQKMRQVVPDIAALTDRLRDNLETPRISPRGAAFALASSQERSFGIQVLGVQPESEPGVSNIPGLVKQGRYLDDPDATEAVIGSMLAKNLKVGLGGELTLMGSGRDGSFSAAVVTVVGIFDSGVPDLDRSIAEIPLPVFQDVFFMDGAGHEIVVSTSGLSEVAELQKAVADLLPVDSGLSVYDWDELQPGLKQAIQADLSSAFAMYLVLVVLVALSVLNTQLMSVLERTHEFGVILALGLTPGRLGRLVLLETALMGLLGLGIGILLGWLLTEYFAIYGFSIPGMDEMAANFNLPERFYPQPNVFTLMLGPSVVFIFTLLSAIYPALKLYWLRPVDAMRAT